MADETTSTTETTEQDTAAEATEKTESSYTPPASQEDLQKIIDGVAARTHKKYEGFEDFKAKAQQWDELADSKKTPDQKAIEEAKTAAAGEVTQKFLRRIVTGEVKSIARDLNFIDPDDALRVLGDELPVKDDEPDTDAIKKLVAKLAEDKPHLVTADSKPAPRIRPKLPSGESRDADKPSPGRAATALRQLGQSRKNT